MRRIISRYVRPDTLIAQAVSIASNRGRGAKVLEPHPERGQEMERLFELAEQTREAMPPVEPSEAFVADLREQLSSAWKDYSVRVDRQRESRRLWLQIAGVAGLMLSGVAILALSVRLIIALLSRRRAARPI